MIEISIIVPVYNTEKYITRCINSILEQTFENWELLLIDDGSRDSSGKICDIFQKKDSRIKVIHKKNEGVSIARNLGITLSKGNYITFVDSDDWIDKDYLELMYIAIKKMNVDILVTGCVYEKENKRENPFKIGKPEVFSKNKAQIEFLKQDKFIWSIYDKLYNKNLFNKYRFNVNLKIAEDMMLFWQLINSVEKIGYFPLYKYHYDISASSTMTSSFSLKWFHPLKVKKKIFYELKNRNLKYKILSRIIFVGEIVGITRKIFLNGNTKDNKYVKFLQRIIRKNCWVMVLYPFSNILTKRQRLGMLFFSLPFEICLFLKRFI